MAGFTVKTFDQLVTDMVSWIVAHSPQITDLSPGSVIRSFCESAGLCLEELYVSTYLGFRRYLETVQEDVFAFPRKAGTKATTENIFSRSGVTGDVTIPLGTRVSTAAGLIYLTTAAGAILDGFTDSAAIEVEAENVGTAYNVLPSTITVIVDSLNGVETTDNANATVGGTDEESDYAYKQRFQAYIEGLGRSNIAGLVAGALSVDGVTSASVEELIPPVADVNVNLYVDDGSVGGLSVAKIAEVQDVIDGDGTEDNPGYRAAGVNVVVLAPTPITQAVTAVVEVLTTGIDQTQVTDDINTALATYMNQLGIGKEIVWAELVAVIMGVYGVYNCSVTTPAGDTPITVTQVGRLGVVTISFGTIAP